MSRYVLITVTGRERPGLTLALMKTIVNHKAQLLDMGQAVTHGFASHSILLDLQGQDSKPLLEELKNETKTHLHEFEYELMDELPKMKAVMEKYLLSCVGPQGISAGFMLDVAQVFATHKITIHRVDKLSTHTLHSVDIAAQCSSPVQWNQIKTEFMAISNRHGVDVAFMQDNAFRYNKRLIVFDMDSTLINAEVIDELAVEAGVGDKVKGITARAMNGELNFDESLRERVALLKGLDRKVLSKVHDRLPLNPGVERFLKTVKALGYRTAIVSGGFTFFAEALKKKLGMDYAFANELEFTGDVLSGKVVGQIINAQQKATILEQLALKESVHLEQVVAIGDGANDLPMLAKAGLGIAFHAKEKVRLEARTNVGHGPMTSVLYFLGIPGGHLE